jgi:hypothetical protein
MTKISVPGDIRYSRDIAKHAAKKLPPRAAEIRRKVQRAHRHRDVAAEASWREVQRISAEMSVLAVELSHTKRTFRNGDYEGGSEPWKRKIAELEEQVEALRVERDAQQAEMASLSSAYPPDLLDGWLAANAGATLKIATVALPKGDPKSALEKVRADRRKLLDERDRAANARLPVEEALKRAVAEIDAIARKGAPYFARTRIVEAKPNGNFSFGSIRWPLVHDEIAGTSRVDADKLAIAINRDRLVEMARAEIERVTDEESGEHEPLTLDERKTRIADLTAQASNLEYVEGALLAALGEEASARHDMDPGALLGLVAVRSVAKAEPERDVEPSAEETARERKRSRLRDVDAKSDGEAEKKHAERIAAKRAKAARTHQDDSEFG